MSEKVKRQKIIIIGATPHSLLNFRGELIRTIVKEGYEVCAVATGASNSEVEQIHELGARYLDRPINRVSINPIKEVRTLLSLRRLFKKEKPDFVLSYTIKPVIWSGIALKGLAGIRFFALITGLGYSFSGKHGLRKLLNKIVVKLYRLALKSADKVIFQNRDDLEYFSNSNIVDAAKCFVVPGSGVPSDRFAFTQLPQKGFRFLMIARLLDEKGVRYYVQAAKKVLERYPHVEFELLGGFDISPSAITQREVQEWVESGIVNYHGEKLDVREYLRCCHVFVLPSHYREGLPRTILEAMSIGRPVITTDNVGCREAVHNNINGILVPIKDSEALAVAMIYLIENKEVLIKMSDAGRRLVDFKYDVGLVNKEMIRLIFKD
ncbi:glycosyltransferase family 4 protein [Pseudidiomarina sp. 1APR75-33.1]|uniref:glycosyltransferase family 4 protein n=1 Tax=Pseudidiomarina terrestris TaxID=2820060 RepID=UPI0026503BEE|nr:glycosyltransferase family 4 protein [Pseudidiomarina sp. 1APR75-33.1]MDN7126936.1 glycosyltransferase family 4 protein [Pseudidiomarina sp. 1APR75-33.1]